MDDRQRGWLLTALIAGPIALIAMFIGAIVLIVASTPPPCGAAGGGFALVAELNPSGAGNWQSAVRDGQYWYVYQAPDAGHQGIIHRLDANGRELDKMTAEGADHAVSFVVRGGRVSVAFYGQVRTFLYRPHSTITRAHTTATSWPHGEISMDPAGSMVVIRNGNHYRAFDAVTRDPVGVEVRTPTGSRQGVGVQGTTLYVLTGPTDQAARVDSYDLKTGRSLSTTDVTKAGLEGVPGYREPEGMYGSQFGVKVYTGSRRRLRIYQLGTGGSTTGLNPTTIPNHDVAGYGHDQLVNAAQIMRAGMTLKLSRRDQTIGVMTAMGESSLVVVDHGDSAGPDSRGLFQQRANGAWGSYADRMDPFRSATSFFQALMRIDGRDTLEPTIVAHRVQGNADPYTYRKYWSAAEQVVAALAGVPAPAAAGAGQAAAGGDSKHYSIGAVKPQTQAIADLLGSKFDIATIYGFRAHDPYPDHPSGLAVDLMVDTDKAKGQAIADYARANADQLGIQYIIWYQHIWNISRASEGWRPMADRGSITANHQNHVHITMRANATVDAAAVTDASVDVTGCSTQDPSGAGAPVAGAHGWVAPADGPVTDTYGWRIHPITHTRRFHYGTDLGGACGSPIRAANAGTVVSVTHPAAYGTLVEVDHGGGVHTRYGHMYTNGVLVNVGDQVTAGQQIAKIGSAGWSTGCHVHVEVSINGKTVNPVSFFASMGVELT